MAPGERLALGDHHIVETGGWREQADWPTSMAPATSIQHKIVVPTSVPMVNLLGAGDELLKAVEREFADLDLHVRGNEITLSGRIADVALVERVIDELVMVLRTGQPLSVDRKSVV